MREFLREQRRAFLRRALGARPENLAAVARALGMDRGSHHRLARPSG
jgi:DNA-binding phage protein